MQLDFSLLIFGESSYIKFHENSSSGSRVVTCGQKNGQTRQICSLFSQFCEHAWKRNLLHSPVLFSSSS